MWEDDIIILTRSRAILKIMQCRLSGQWQEGMTQQQSGFSSSEHSSVPSSSYLKCHCNLLGAFRIKRRDNHRSERKGCLFLKHDFPLASPRLLCPSSYPFSCVFFWIDNGGQGLVAPKDLGLKDLLLPLVFTMYSNPAAYPVSTRGWHRPSPSYPKL